MDAIRSKLREEDAAGDEDIPGRPAEDPLAAFEKLSWMVGEHDTEALEVFGSLRAILESVAGQEETKTLADLLSAYDFAAALPPVRGLEHRMREYREGGGTDGRLT